MSKNQQAALALTLVVVFVLAFMVWNARGTAQALGAGNKSAGIETPHSTGLLTEQYQ